MNWINKAMVFIVVIAADFFLTGCPPEDGGPGLGDPYIGGAVGLNTYLIEGMPPPMIHDSGNFPFGIGIALENLGETDVGPSTECPYVLVRLEGINPEQFGVTDQDIEAMLDVPLRGAKRNFDGSIFPGEITVVAFDGLNYLPDIHGNTQFTIRAVVCYDYETLSTTTICIKDDVLENIQDTSICTLSGEKLPQNSGGPLQVTSVVQNGMAKNKIQVNFVIEHVGIGEFFGIPQSGDPEERCSFSIRNFNKYYVDVEVEPLVDSGMHIECSRFSGSNKGRIRLYQGAPTTVTCTIIRDRGSQHRIYQDLLNIKLRYRYGQFIETGIIVQDVTN